MRLPLRLLDVSVMGLVFPVATILGYLAGRAVGGWFDAEAGGALVGSGVGIVAGFYNAYRTVKRLAVDEQNDAPRDR